MGLRAYVRSTWGVVLNATRQNELRARALGFNTWAIKYAAFVFSGMVAGLAGALFAYQAGIVVPANVSVLISGTAVFMVLVGGVRTLYGAILGAVTLTVMQYYGALVLPATWPLFMGALFILIVLFSENGIYVVGVDRRIARRAAQVRAGSYCNGKGLALADAIIIATAIETECDAIVGNDGEWRRLKDIRFVCLDDLAAAV